MSPLAPSETDSPPDPVLADERAHLARALDCLSEMRVAATAVTDAGVDAWASERLVLMTAGAIVIGTALLLGGPAQPDLAEAAPATTPRRWHVTRNAVRTSSGVMVMAGLAAIVLAVIALAGPGPTVALTAVALVCTAAALVLAGGSIAARFTRRFA